MTSGAASPSPEVQKTRLGKVSAVTDTQIEPVLTEAHWRSSSPRKDIPSHLPTAALLLGSQPTPGADVQSFRVVFCTSNSCVHLAGLLCVQQWAASRKPEMLKELEHSERFLENSSNIQEQSSQTEEDQIGFR